MRCDEVVLGAIASADLPVFVYDLRQVRQNVAALRAAFADYRYPVKANPESSILATVLECGAGLDLCSSGDIGLSRELGCRPSLISYSSPVVREADMAWLAASGAHMNADSLSQVARWSRIADRGCGVRLCTADRNSVYGAKFGLLAADMASSVAVLADRGLRLAGVQVHEDHTVREASAVADRMVTRLEQIPDVDFSQLEYVNIGGGWPMLDSNEALGRFACRVRARLDCFLGSRSFSGAVLAELGQAVVGPAGYWAARVVAVKPHPWDSDRRNVILDTATPVPCRPSAAPFLALDGSTFELLVGDQHPADIYGSANTGSDTIGVGLALPPVGMGDVIISTGQGAYVRSLIGSFNERLPPPVLCLG